MPQESVEAVRRAYEAWNADDLDAVLAELDPEAEAIFVAPSGSAMPQRHAQLMGTCAATLAWKYRCPYG